MKEKDREKYTKKKNEIRKKRKGKREREMDGKYGLHSPGPLQASHWHMNP